jgi:hypothetical protein
MKDLSVLPTAVLAGIFVVSMAGAAERPNLEAQYLQERERLDTEYREQVRKFGTLQMIAPNTTEKDPGLIDLSAQESSKTKPLIPSEFEGKTPEEIKKAIQSEARVKFDPNQTSASSPEVRSLKPAVTNPTKGAQQKASEPSAELAPREDVVIDGTGISPMIEFGSSRKPASAEEKK